MGGEQASNIPATTGELGAKAPKRAKRSGATSGNAALVTSRKRSHTEQHTDATR